MTGEKRVHVETSCNFRYQDAGSFMLKKQLASTAIVVVPTDAIHDVAWCGTEGWNVRYGIIWMHAVKLQCKAVGPRALTSGET